MLFIAIIVPAVLILVGLAVCGGLLFFSIRARNRIRLIQAAPLCKADQLITGLAKLRGTIVPLDDEDLLKSPLTKTYCVYFRFVVEEQRTRTVSSMQGNRSVTRTETYWHPIVTDVQTVPTAVKDKTGEALLDLTEAELTLKAMRATSGTFKTLSADLERMLQKRYGVSSKGLIFNKSMRYTESVIEPDTKVFVVGDCKVKKSGTASFWKKDNPLLVTDKNEEELVGHYKKRFIGFMIGAIVAPLFFFVIAGFVGMMIYKTTKHVPGPQRPGPQQPGPQQAPGNVDKITPLLVQLNDANQRKRGDAARQLADLPVDETAPQRGGPGPQSAAGRQPFRLRARFGHHRHQEMGHEGQCRCTEQADRRHQGQGTNEGGGPGGA